MYAIRSYYEETINFKVIYDADLIVNLEEKQKESPSSPEHLAKIIEKSFLTKSGHRITSYNVCYTKLLRSYGGKCR